MRKPPIHRSFWNAIKGVMWLIKSERNFQIEVFALLINVFLILYFKLTANDAALIFAVSFAVLGLEILNTCVEKICDYLQPEFDLRIGIIKDLAGGAVLLATISAICVGVLVYWPYLKLYFY